MEKKQLRGLIFAGLVILFLLSLILKEYNIELMNVFGETNNTLEIMSEQKEYSNKSKYFFANIGKDLLVGNKDGLKRTKAEGLEVWNVPFSLHNPVMVNEGEYTVIGDVGGKEVHVFDGRGLVYNVTTNYPILEVVVNSQGRIVVIEESKDAQLVTVYDHKGEPTFKVNVVPERDGYPIGIAINDGGNKLAISFLDTSEIEMSNKLVFYRTDSVDINRVDQIVGSIHSEGVIGQVFALGNTFIGVATDRIFGINYESEIKETFSLPLTNKVMAVTYHTEKKQFAVAYGDALPGVQENNDKKVLVYDHIGNNLYSHQAKKRIDHLAMGKKSLIIGAGHDFVSLGRNGDVKWRFTATIDIRQAVELSDDQVVLVGENYYQLYKKIKNVVEETK